MVRADLLEDSLEVVCRWPCLALATTHNSRDVAQARATSFLIVAIVAVGSDRNPPRTLLVPLLPPLAPFLASWTVTSDGATLLLPGVASLLPDMGRSLATSLPVVY
jgi:hypothetical protein